MSAGDERIDAIRERLADELREVVLDVRQPRPPIGSGYMSWRDSAACVGLDPALFFADKGEQSGGTVAEAKRVCMDCPAREPCLDEAIANGEKFGIWGGLSPKERRRLPRHESRERWLAGIARRRAETVALWEAGWTQEAIAARVGRSVSTVRDDLYSARKIGAA